MKTKLIIHILIMIAVFVGAWSVYGVWYAHVNHESAQAAALAAQIQSQTEMTARAQLAKDELSKVTGEQAVVTQYFVNTSDIVTFLESLQTAGQGVGSNVSVVSVSAEPGTPHNHLNLSISITGTFDSVMRTLGSLEYSAHDITITSVTLDTTGNGKTASQWTAAVTLRVGTLATPAVAAPKQAAAPNPVPTSTATTTTKAASTTPK